MKLVGGKRVPIDFIGEKVRRIVQEDVVVAETGGDVKMGLAGREFSCYIHSDLPGKSATLLTILANANQNEDAVQTLKEVRKALNKYT